MASAGELVRQVRGRIGWSTRALGGRAGVTPGRMAAIEFGADDVAFGEVEACASAVGWQVVVVPGRGLTAAAAAVRVTECLAVGEEGERDALLVVAELCQGLGQTVPDMRVALCVTPPMFCGDERFDALLTAVVEARLGVSGLPVPAWVHEPGRALAEPWVPVGSVLAAEVPREFSARRVMSSEVALLRFLTSSGG